MRKILFSDGEFGARRRLNSYVPVREVINDEPQLYVVKVLLLFSAGTDGVGNEIWFAIVQYF